MNISMKTCILLQLWVKNDNSEAVIPVIFEVKYKDKHYAINYYKNDFTELNDYSIVQIMKDYTILQSHVLSMVLAKIHQDHLDELYKQDKKCKRIPRIVIK
jgi:uncharacterized protein with ParB-like and HNH nuclease domain